MAILKVENIKKYYGSEENLVRALDGINLEIQTQELVAIVGTSGSGKSTLLHMLGGLDTPTQGGVLINGNEISKMNAQQLTIFRRQNIGFIFQNFNLIPVLNVYENIVLPIELDDKKIDEEYVEMIIKMLGLDTKKESMPSMLSGGQQQRVAIARALATKPAIVLADEPTGNLDSKTSQDVLNILKMTATRFKQTILLITHDDRIARLAHRMIRIEDGKIKEDVRNE